MKFISLTDITSNNIITIDVSSYILMLEIDSKIKEMRLKPHYTEILYEMFSLHPQPISYYRLIEIFKKHKHVIDDLMRMHRKISEVRTLLKKFHPSLHNVIVSVRNIGYNLSLDLRNIHRFKNSTEFHFRNPIIQKNLDIIHELIEDVILITSKCNIVEHFQGFILNTYEYRQTISEKISKYNQLQEILLYESGLYKAEFKYLRIEYTLIKLKTYIGLARISSYSISHSQWIDWFKKEIWILFDNLKKLLKDNEI